MSRRLIYSVFLLLLLVQLSSAQLWRRDMMEVSSRPGRQATLADIRRLEQSALLAAPFYYGLQPGDYEANREIVRQAAVYLATAELVNRDPQFQQALGRAFVAVANLRWLPGFGVRPFGMQAQNQQPQAPATLSNAAPEEPRFSRQAPQIPNVSAADQEIANDLSTRYELAVGKATIAWRTASMIRKTLAAQGLSLNASTEASVAKLQLYFDLADDSLVAKNWPEARINIERVEYESDRILKVTGR